MLKDWSMACYSIGYGFRDACEVGAVIALGIGLILALFVLFLVICTYVEDYRLARIRNAPSNPYAYAERTETQTVNLKGNR